MTVGRKTGRRELDPRRILWPLALVLAVLLLVGGPGYRSTRSIAAAWDLGHVVAFALWSHLLVSWRPVSEASVSGQWGAVLAFCLIAGSATEGFQWMLGGDASAGDFLRDVVGGVFAMSWLSPSAKKLRDGGRRAARWLAAVLMFFTIVPLVAALSDEAIARHQFPTLSDFETPLETYRWDGNARFSVDRSFARRGKGSLRVEMGPARYSGIFLVHFPGDWRGYRLLAMDVLNPSQEEIVVTCRIHDKLHEEGEQRHEDRFNRTFRLPPGWSDIRVDLGELTRAPAGREMDLGRIRAVGLFAADLQQDRTMYLDSVRLE